VVVSDRPLRLEGLPPAEPVFELGTNIHLVPSATVRPLAVHELQQAFRAPIGQRPVPKGRQARVANASPPWQHHRSMVGAGPWSFGAPAGRQAERRAPDQRIDET
jgi:hypothetical protein